MDITDLIQEGAAGLTRAVDRIDKEMLLFRIILVSSCYGNLFYLRGSCFKSYAGTEL